MQSLIFGGGCRQATRLLSRCAITAQHCRPIARPCPPPFPLPEGNFACNVHACQRRSTWEHLQAASTAPDRTVTSPVPSSVHHPGTCLPLKSPLSLPRHPAARSILPLPPPLKAQNPHSCLSLSKGAQTPPPPGTGQQGIGRALWDPQPCLPSDWQQGLQHHRHTLCGGAHWGRRSVRFPAHQQAAEPSSSSSRRVAASWGRQQGSRSSRSRAASSSGLSPTWPWPRSS